MIEREEPWIQSFSGRKITPLHLRPEQVCLEDIAHALSNKARFTGHTREFYSVAQHCVIGSRLMPPSYALAFLLHDVSETYLPDIASPLKSRVRWIDAGGLPVYWTGLEQAHQRVIFQALWHESLLPLLASKEVREMDIAMLLAERDAFLLKPPADWMIEGTPAPVALKSWTPLQAEACFLDQYHRCTKASVEKDGRIYG